MDSNEVEFDGLLLQKKDGFFHVISFNPSFVANTALKIDGSFLTKNEESDTWIFLGGDSVGWTMRPRLSDKSEVNAMKLHSFGVPILDNNEAKKNLELSNKPFYDFNS